MVVELFQIKCGEEVLSGEVTDEQGSEWCERTSHAKVSMGRIFQAAETKALGQERLKV